MGLSGDWMALKGIPSKITELKNTSHWVDEKILRFNVAVANAERVDVGKGAEQLIHVKLDVDHWHLLALPHVVTSNFGYGVRDKLEHQV